MTLINADFKVSYVSYRFEIKNYFFSIVQPNSFATLKLYLKTQPRNENTVQYCKD